jgi:hypothetical protein
MVAVTGIFMVWHHFIKRHSQIRWRKTSILSSAWLEHASEEFIVITALECAFLLFCSHTFLLMPIGDCNFCASISLRLMVTCPH